MATVSSESIAGFVAALPDSPLAPFAELSAWEITTRSIRIVNRILETLSRADYVRSGDQIAIHCSAVVEAGAILKGPLIVGPDCFIASGAYLRGGNWIGARCTLGPGTELKSSFVFSDTKLAHFNFVGDSILGSDVNLEAGSSVCNFRNERINKQVLIRRGRELIGTGCNKFGALVGDRCRVGGNAIIAPGSILRPGTVVQRGTLLDQEIAEQAS